MGECAGGQPGVGAVYLSGFLRGLIIYCGKCYSKKDSHAVFFFESIYLLERLPNI